MNHAQYAIAHEIKIRQWQTFTPPQSTADAAHCGLVCTGAHRFSVVMHPGRCHAKTSQGANWAEKADNADETEIAQAPYFLSFANGMREMQEGLAERGGVSSYA